MSRANRKAVKRNRNYQTSQMGRDHAQDEAEKLFRIGLKKIQTTGGGLGSLQGNDERKIAIAESIHRNTTASQGCVAERLRMKSGGECKPAVRTETETGNTQREIKAETSGKLLGQRQI